MKNYVIPFFYTFYTRIKGNGKRIAYLFTFIIPVFLYAFVTINNSKESITSIAIAIVVSLIGTMSIYEIGYIRNDVFTIKKEKNPTLRLKKEELTYVEMNIKVILLIKYIITLISLVIIFFMGYNALQYLVGLILIEVVYFIHNTIRGKLSIVSFFILSTLRYIVPLVILNTKLEITILVFILVISVPRTIEKAAEKKFNIKVLNFVNESIDINFLRFIYYIALVINVLAQLFTNRISYLFLILSVYYLIYRGLIFAIIFMKNRNVGIQ